MTAIPIHIEPDTSLRVKIIDGVRHGVGWADTRGSPHASGLRGWLYRLPTAEPDPGHSGEGSVRMRLSEQLWSEIGDVYTAILDHPFITGLTDGSLPRDAFRHFIVQDAHYLRGFARALTVCAAKAPDEHGTVMFAEHAAGAIRAEQEMHAELAGELGLSPEQLAAQSVGPTTRAYGSYLLATVHGGSFAEGLAAVLPCYWIYARVGDALLERSSPDPLYARWISMYGGEEFQSIVNDVLALTDRVGAELSELELGRVREHFVTTARYEWMFWDAGYRQEAWPI